MSDDGLGRKTERANSRMISKIVARPTGLDHRFAERSEARGDLETAAA
jgi:hypothetical protein